MSSLYVISGEHSGDSHGADLIKALRGQNEDSVFRGLGGPKMRAQSSDIQDWVDEAAVVGFIEVIKRYSWFKRRFRETLAEIEDLQPEAVIFVDYPGFNLRLAKALRERGFAGKLIYYISPQVWAWNRKRIPRMAGWLDRMLCLFPFEKELFEEAGLRTDWVGHPLVEELANLESAMTRERDLVGLFPGSREREIERLLPVMLQAGKRLLAEGHECRFRVPLASVRFRQRVNEMVEESGIPHERIEVQQGGSRELMQTAWCGLVASGTATLEAAYFGMPYALVYKVAWPTYLLGRMLVRVEHLGMINILAGEEIIHEFIQADAEPNVLSEELAHLLDDEARHELICRRLAKASALLGEPGASERAAAAVLDALKG